MASPAGADLNRFRRSMTSSASRAQDAAATQDVRERLKKVEQLQAAGKSAEAVAELLAIAEAYAVRGAPVKAVAVLRQATKIKPDAADLRVALGDVAQQLRMVEDAAREYGTAFELYERAQQFGEMMQVLGRVLELDPDNHAGQLQLAEHLARAGHNHEAADLLRGLAATLLRKGSVDDWEKVAERAHGLEATDVTLAHDLALHYVRSNRPSLALGKLLRCYESVPNDAELLELIIEALEQLGQREKAAVICRQLIATFERNGLVAEANKALERLYYLAPDDERARAYMGVMAPSVQGGTVIELQPRSSGALAPQPVGDAAPRPQPGVAVGRSRPGTMALPEADLARLQAAIARQAEEKASAMLADAPPLPAEAEASATADDADETVLLQVPSVASVAKVPTAPAATAVSAASSAPAHAPAAMANSTAAASSKPVPAVVHAPTATQPMSAQSMSAQPGFTQAGFTQPLPVAAATPATASGHVVPAGVRAPSGSFAAPTAARGPQATLPMHGRPSDTVRAADLSPAGSISRVTHQQALEALSELDDLEGEDGGWDDEAGFDNAERTLVEELDPAVLERHGIRLGDAPVPELQMTGLRPTAQAPGAFNPVAPASPRSNILPRPRLSRQGSVETAAASGPRDMSRDLGTLEFFIERGFHDSAIALLDALEQRHPGAAELASYRLRIAQMRRES